jgi:hypothetical protein
MGVPHLTYVVHVELHRAIGLLRFLHWGQQEMRAPFTVVGMVDRLPRRVASSGGSISLSYGPNPYS